MRIRENQRRSRARRKEYVETMERKLQEYERRGVDATLEMQQAARTVAVENARLRLLLAQMGARAADVDAFLQAFQDRDAAHTLSLVRLVQGGGGVTAAAAAAESETPSPVSGALCKLDVLAAASVQQGCCGDDGWAPPAPARAESPSTVEPSPGAATPSSHGGGGPSPALSCDAAAKIIADMHGRGGPVKDEPACGGSPVILPVPDGARPMG